MRGERGDDRDSSINAARSWSSCEAHLYGASPIGTGRNCSGSGAYLSPLPLLFLFHHPRVKCDEPRSGRTKPLSRHACIHALLKWTIHAGLTRPVSFRITQPNDDHGGAAPHRATSRRAAPHRKTSWPHLPPPRSCRTTIRERDWLARTTRAPRFLSVGIDVFFSPFRV